MTNIIHKLAGPLGRRVFRGFMRSRSAIFMLHRLHNPACGVRGHSIEFVRRALSALQESGAQFVPLQAMVDCWLNGRTADPSWIAFTIDDGFADQCELVRQAFLPMKCPVTVFVITGLLDGKLWPWDDQLAHAFHETRLTHVDFSLASKRFEFDLGTAQQRLDAVRQVREICKKMPNADLYECIATIGSKLLVELPLEPPAAFKAMSWDEARKLEQAGVSFAAHSVTHRIFSRLTYEEVHHEVVTSSQRLRAELRDPPPFFAWPTGRNADFESKDMQIAKEAGLVASFATDNDYAYIDAEDPLALYRIKRLPLPHDLTTVLRYGSWMERARQCLPI